MWQLSLFHSFNSVYLLGKIAGLFIPRKNAYGLSNSLYLEIY